ncbi:MAG: transcriptional regulator [Bacteroidetes bacterium CG2_30_33_31]|nr:MAG: transcriptional regulator [Bacteroidetes bacterium CG2_30_33_31]
MLDTLITNKTRIKLLIKFFLNSNSKSYLRNLEHEFNESSNAIRIELNKFEKSGLLNSEVEGNKKVFTANTNHPLFKDIHNILLKHLGIDTVIDEMISNLGMLKKVYLVGDIAKGKDSDIIDLLLVGAEINKDYLTRLIEKAERLIQRKVRYLIFGEDEIENFLKSKGISEYLLLWKE